MRGRKKEPTALHAIKGTDRADRRNAAEPVPPKRAPQRPKWLDGRSRAGKLWDELCELFTRMQVMTPADEIALALLTDRLMDYVDADAYLKKHGETYDSFAVMGADDGDEDEALTVVRKMRRPNPEVAMKQAAFKDVKSMLGEFGMTPSTRARLAAVPDDVPDELAAFLGSRKKSNGRSA